MVGILVAVVQGDEYVASARAGSIVGKQIACREKSLSCRRLCLFDTKFNFISICWGEKTQKKQQTNKPPSQFIPQLLRFKK